VSAPLDPRDVPDQWEFYFCQLEDVLASISVNLWFLEAAPLESADTLYTVRIKMLDPDSHGLGTSGEADALYRAELSVAEALAPLGLYFVGRMRTAGKWRLVFFGPPGRERDVGDTVSSWVGARQVDTIAKADPEWSFARDFLFPDEERQQWIRDRQVVERLRDRGDSLSAPRRVDHRIYFRQEAHRDAFLAEVRDLGFDVAPAAELVAAEGSDERVYLAQIARTDPVELDAIHEVVCTLRDVASRHEGTYDGWETMVVGGSAN
jgi:uncharacterized protein (TIGR01619 family)